MAHTTIPAHLMAPAEPVRVNLAFPIEVPGGEIAAVWVRPLHEKMGKLANTDFEGEITALADSIRLAPDMVLSLDEADYLRVREALLEATARYVRAGETMPPLHAVKGEAE